MIKWTVKSLWLILMPVDPCTTSHNIFTCAYHTSMCIMQHTCRYMYTHIYVGIHTPTNREIHLFAKHVHTHTCSHTHTQCTQVCTNTHTHKQILIHLLLPVTHVGVGLLQLLVSSQAHCRIASKPPHSLGYIQSRQYLLGPGWDSGRNYKEVLLLLGNCSALLCGAIL